MLRLRRRSKDKDKDKLDTSCTSCSVPDFKETLNGTDNPERKQNGGSINMRSGSIPGTTGSPPPERKSKLSALGRFFKPWKWKRKKKSEKIESVAGDLERNLSFRSNREELIRRGILKPDDTTTGQDETDQSKNKDLSPVPEDSVKEDKYEVPTANGSTPSASTAGHNGSHYPHDHDANTIPMASQSLSPDSQVAHSDSLGTIRPHSALPGQRNVPREPLVDTPQHQNPSVMAFKVLPPLPPQHKFHNYEEVVQRKEEASHPYNPSYDSKVQQKNEHYDNVPHNHVGVHVKGGINVMNHGHAMTLPPKPSSPRVHQQNDYSKSTPVSSMQRFSYTSNTLPHQSGSPSLPYGVSHLPYPVLDTSRVEEIPAREPNLQLLPKKSALKNSGGPKVAPKPKMKPRVVKMARIESDKENIPENDDSDDGDIRWRDDDDEEGWASKVARRDSLARFLSNRPQKNELENRNILPSKSDVEKLRDREVVGQKLIRRLSLRPSAEELESRNILHRQTLDEIHKERDEMRKVLTRKLSFRPTIEELKERKIIKFSDYVEFSDCQEYDRKADKPWTRLTPKDKAAIRKELNEYKSSEMPVHEGSKHLTRFHRP